MDNVSGLQMCPVCTLYMRPGITLQDHLFTHPKDQVIEALVRLASTGPGVVVNGEATINTNSQFTAITYRQFQTLTSTPAVPESSVPVVFNSCFVNNPSSFTSSVIRSSVPLLSYPFCSEHQQQDRVDNDQTQCSFSLATQTTQTNSVLSTQSNLSFNTPVTEQAQETNGPEDEQFLNENFRKNHKREDSCFGRDATDIQRDRNPNFNSGKIENDLQNSDDVSIIDNIHKQNGSFENQCVCVVNGSVTPVPFMEKEDIEKDLVLNERSKYNEEEPHTNNETHDIDTTVHSLGAVLSNTHRLIANDPMLDYNQDIRPEEIDYREPSYRLSPSRNISPPVSEESNWSTSSGLRVRRDLNSLGQSVNSSNCIMYVRPNSNESEYVTSDPYDLESGHNSSEIQLTNLDNVNYSLVLQYSNNQQLTNMISNENNEDHSQQETPLNIHSDELMPPKGELSGQESLGATENSVWELYDQGEPTVANLQATEKDQRWQMLSSVLQDRSDTALTKKNRSVKCLECDMKFESVHERRMHVQTEHKTPQHTQVKDESASKTKRGNFKLENAQLIKIKQERLSFKLETNTRTCIECGLELQTIKELRKHKREFHEQKRKCATCETVFDDYLSYKDHIAKIHPIECTVCGKFFTTKSTANIHAKTHLKYKPYQCTVCDKSFVSSVKLSEHNNIHSGEAPYKCAMCDQSFKRQSNLIQHKNFFHLKIKKKIKDYFCHCGEIFHSIKKLHWHKETHDSKPKQCLYCSERYVHSTSLTRHIRHAHDSTYLPKATKSLNTLCPICKITCIRTSLAQHMKIHKGDKPFTCNVCSKEFSTNWNLQMHKWTHASRNSKPYKCKQCKCAFYMLSSYQAHVRSHRNIRPYTCNYCGQQFIRKYNCVRHVKEHETNKSYCCAICNKTFHRSYYLTEHMRTHTGVKPFTCHICSKTSSTKSNHNKHLRTHHAREPVNTEG